MAYGPVTGVTQYHRWQVLSVLALKMLPPGRAASVGYTMPVWAGIVSVLFCGERPSPRHWFGIVIGSATSLLLLVSEFARLAGNPFATMLIAAVA
jgi:drug/metabolite transporter (DMT)-like permease